MGFLAWGALAAAGAFSARWNWWRPRAGGLPVLMYHKIGDPPPGSRLGKLWVSTAMFRRQLHYLKEKGYVPLTFGAVARSFDAGRPLPTGAVVITLDDGYRNNYENAFPLLQEFGFPAVIYLVINAVGRDNFWHNPLMEARLPMLSWEDVAVLEAGGIEIGSHTLNHPRLSRLLDEEARREITDSLRELEKRVQSPSPCFAYPYGNGADDPRLWAMARSAGYRWAVSVHPGKADLATAPYCLRRIFVRGDDTMWDFHLNLTRGRARL
jgi:peptidoglycan/xylan/chitin deacetylase (PgdA/CDA1 family)